MASFDPSRHNLALAGLCYAVAAGILTQAVLAGLFISGIADARMAHLIVGWLLPYVALAVPVVALVQRRRGHASRGVMIGAVALPVALWVQEVLGALPAPATTAIHVPFGVALLTYAVLLGLASTRTTAGTDIAGASTGHAAGAERSAEAGARQNDASGRGRNATQRLVVLIVASLVIANAVAAMLFERDTALGPDELLVSVAGVGLALLVEFGVFRRGRW